VAHKNLKSTIETAANIAVVLVAIAALSSLAIVIFVEPTAPNLRKGLAKGNSIQGKIKADFSSSEKTLLIALKTNCSFCTESLPFYQRLIQQASSGDRPLRIIALFPQTSEQAANYLKENQLSVEVVSEVDFDAISIPGTLTLILLDKTEVKDFWVGTLSKTDEDRVLLSLGQKVDEQQ